jgi:hypothetical protein
MPQLTFYPLGNAESCFIDLDNGQKLLFDYADTRNPDDREDRRINLPGALRNALNAAGRDDYDVVALSHLDDDHIHGSSEFFYLQHNKKYQDDNRVKIKELWVPAAVIVEDKDACGEEHLIIQAEARYRLKQRSGIRVFSRPDLLKDWLKKQGIAFNEVEHLITDAGQLVPGFTKESHGVEFFVHSPFAKRLNDNELVDRNCDCLVFQATFLVQSYETRVLLSGDTTYDILADIVDVTRWHKREDRLEWDVFKIPHHCSYLSIGPDKGKSKTEPVANVKWLFEEQGHGRAIIVSCSDPITSEDTVQPPHFQAANYYREVVSNLVGEFKVTMEHPSRTTPQPLIIKIDGSGARVVKRNPAGGSAVIGGSAPRAGATYE